MREFVTVRGVVYVRPRAGEGQWLRRSVPPDATPGKRSKWPPVYQSSRLPGHEVIDESTALDLIDKSLSRLDELGIRRTGEKE